MRIPAREVRYGGAMIDQKEIDAVVNVMKTGMSVGEQVQTFESRCARLLGKEYGVMVNSGSSALLIAVRLLDLPPGSEIITPTLTFGTDISCIVLNGHVPVLVDVEPDTYQVDIDRIERNITPLTRALLIPSLVGGMPDWDRLRALADKHGLKIIEDSCDTLGGTYRGTPAGDRSDISVTSFSDLPHHHPPRQRRPDRDQRSAAVGSRADAARLGPLFREVHARHAQERQRRPLSRKPRRYRIRRAVHLRGDRLWLHPQRGWRGLRP